MKEEENKFWLTKVEPFEGESISHFLGRFRRARGNRFSAPSGLGEVAGLGAILARWEKFYFSPFPTPQELEKLATVVMLDVDRLREMFPYQGMVTQIKPIMLCGMCYQEVPYHRLQWQDKNKRGCDCHKVKLLSKCPNCGTSFSVPSLWKDGRCDRCHLSFIKMSKKQK
ncbi:hypothetical protein [Geminocystis herdmanii]|uniref:hypothetical protein n=1 Tax=Geminocystis herdmanii TaxID=669359 RepID=UPI000344C473|nr:hypothetical protein [Geminocystis herdmanii]